MRERRRMQDFLDQLLIAYSDGKLALSEFTGAPEDLLHVHAGLLIFVVSALVLRKKMRSPVPLLLVVFFAAANEVADWAVGKPVDTFHPIGDFLNTVFWPAVLFLLARRWR
jgi:hypothetical protein